MLLFEGCASIDDVLSPRSLKWDSFDEYGLVGYLRNPPICSRILPVGLNMSGSSLRLNLAAVIFVILPVREVIKTIEVLFYLLD